MERPHQEMCSQTWLRRQTPQHYSPSSCKTLRKGEGHQMNPNSAPVATTSPNCTWRYPQLDGRARRWDDEAQRSDTGVKDPEVADHLEIYWERVK